MANITLKRTIGVPIERVWEVLSDFGSVHRYHPGVETSPIKEGTPTSGVGSERVCNLYDGNHLTERVTDFVEKQKLVIEVIDSSMPMNTAAGVFDLRPMGQGKTEVTLTMKYVVKFGPFGAIMDKLLLERTMTRSLNALLAGLDHHLESGETIGKGWKAAQVA